MIAIPGRRTPGRRRTWRSDAASIAPVFPAETTASASPSPTALDRAHQGRAGLGADRVGRLLVHLDRLAAADELQAARIEGPRAEEDRRDLVRGCGERALDDLVRRTIAAESVDRDANRHPAGATARAPGAAGSRARGTSCTSGTRGATASASRSSRRSRHAARRSRAAPGACRGGTSRSCASERP